MSKLVDEIRKDPNAVFEVEADLPSGNRMSGTVGPMIGDRLHCAITFRDSPASDEDIRVARLILDKAMGQPAEIAITSHSPKERAEALRKMRGFLGGGRG